MDWGYIVGRVPEGLRGCRLPSIGRPTTPHHWTHSSAWPSGWSWSTAPGTALNGSPIAQGNPPDYLPHAFSCLLISISNDDIHPTALSFDLSLFNRIYWHLHHFLSDWQKTLFRQVSGFISWAVWCAHACLPRTSFTVCMFTIKLTTLGVKIPVYIIVLTTFKNNLYFTWILKLRINTFFMF